MEQDPLNTKRLLLRPFKKSDAADVQRLAGVREVSDMTDAIPYPYADGMAEEWIATHPKSWFRKLSAVYAVCNKADEKLIGCVGLSLMGENSRASLGYWFGVEFWGEGYCTEACLPVLAFGFDSLNLNRIEAFHVVHNPASGAVMKKLGMQHEATHREYFLKNGKFHDAERYAIIASDRRRNEL